VNPSSPFKPLQAPSSPFKPLQAPSSPFKPLQAPSSPFKVNFGQIFYPYAYISYFSPTIRHADNPQIIEN